MGGLSAETLQDFHDRSFRSMCQEIMELRAERTRRDLILNALVIHGFIPAEELSLACESYGFTPDFKREAQESSLDALPQETVPE